MKMRAATKIISSGGNSMSAIKSVLKMIVLFAALAAIMMTSGCGTSAEKEKMITFMQELQSTLDTYADIISKGDNGKKTEIEVKLDDMENRWKHLKEQISTEVTPQTMEKFNAEFGKLMKKYAELSGKS
jgi:hypothetical protein